jgi:excisionase family DNA binding protein
MSSSENALDGLRAFIADVVRAELGKTTEVDEYLSTFAAAAFAKVAPGTIRRWVKNGKLRDHRAGRLMRIRRSDLERLLREGMPRNDSLTPEQIARRKYG